MSNRIVELAVRISADVASDVEQKIEGVGSSSQKMADNVESSTTRGAAGIERMGGASEGLDDKFGRAAGAAGALSSGADLIGNEKASAALQAMALATDFFSGVGQAGILVTEGLSLATAENVIVSKAQAAASKVQAGAQAALNAVMSANPILLVVVAIAALVAGFVLAYKHSETFRDIVQKAGKVAAAGLHLVVDTIGDIIDWVGRVVDKFDFLALGVKGYVFVIKTEIGLIVDVVKFVADHVDDAGQAWSNFKGKAVDAASTIASKAGHFFDVLMKPVDVARDGIDDLLDLIDKIIDKISHIHLPSLPHIPGLGRTVAGAGESTTSTPGVSVTVNLGGVTIELPVASDPASAAQAIVAALVDQANRLGVTVLQLLQQNGVVAA